MFLKLNEKWGHNKKFNSFTFFLGTAMRSMNPLPIADSGNSQEKLESSSGRIEGGDDIGSIELAKDGGSAKAWVNLLTVCRHPSTFPCKFLCIPNLNAINSLSFYSVRNPHKEKWYQIQGLFFSFLRWCRKIVSFFVFGETRLGLRVEREKLTFI